MKLHTQGYCMSLLALIGAVFGALMHDGVFLVLALLASAACFTVARFEHKRYRRDVERLRGPRIAR